MQSCGSTQVSHNFLQSCSSALQQARSSPFNQRSTLGAARGGSSTATAVAAAFGGSGTLASNSAGSPSPNNAVVSGSGSGDGGGRCAGSVVAAATSGDAGTDEPELRCSNNSNSTGAAGASPTRSGKKAAPRLLRVLEEFRACMIGTEGATGQLSAAQVATLSDVLRSVPLQELGLKPPSDDQGIKSVEDAFQRLLLMSGQRRPPITYLHIYEDPEVSIGIFCLPAGATIPLHNHPGMTVFSRLLYGQMFVQAFDWYRNGDVAAAEADLAPAPAAVHVKTSAVEPTNASAAAPEGRPARLVLSRVQSPADAPLVLFPESGGNLHTFTALTDCAVLDVLSPPYDTANDRDCTYYYIAGGATNAKGSTDPVQQTLNPASAAAVLENGGGGAAAACNGDAAPYAGAAGALHQATRGVVRLVEFDPPADFVVTRGEYRGLRPLLRLSRAECCDCPNSG